MRSLSSQRRLKRKRRKEENRNALKNNNAKRRLPTCRENTNCGSKADWVAREWRIGINKIYLRKRALLKFSTATKSTPTRCLKLHQRFPFPALHSKKIKKSDTLAAKLAF